jgi:alanine dehydrogenase
MPVFSHGKIYFCQKERYMLKFGIIREGKNPPDRRTPLTPGQVKLLMDNFHVEFYVQSSPYRAFSDDEYRERGIPVTEDLSMCDVILGVKEVPVDMLIPEKTYIFFSHTIKKQPYNRQMLQEILKRKIRLIDYETMVDAKGKRLVGFGKYAGIVGAYNGLKAYGLLSNAYHLKPAYQCFDLAEMLDELTKIQLPVDFKIAITGTGRVCEGVIEIMRAADIEQVSPYEYVFRDHTQPVFAVIKPTQYYMRKDGKVARKSEIYDNPIGYESDFLHFARESDLYITAHYWDNRAPYILTNDMLLDPFCRIKVVADISCDIGGPIACTIRPSTIENPIYAYDPESQSEVPLNTPNSIAVMAVDNLPCELPRDASEGFGKELMDKIFSELLKSHSPIIERATITLPEGVLAQRYEYLADYVSQESDLEVSTGQNSK